MTQPTPTDAPINTANRIAPAPATEDDAARDVWVRHYAAQALACWATFRAEIRTLTPNPEPGSRPDLGFLAMAAVASTTAAAALIEDPDPVLLMDAPNVTALIWELTPELGALNGEYEEWLTDVLVRYGVNPGEIDPDLDPADFIVEDWRLDAPYVCPECGQTAYLHFPECSIAAEVKP